MIFIYLAGISFLLIGLVFTIKKQKKQELEIYEIIKAEEEERQAEIERLKDEIIMLEMSRQRKRQTGDFLEKQFEAETDAKKKIVLLNKIDTIDKQLYKLDKKIKTLQDEIRDL